MVMYAFWFGLFLKYFSSPFSKTNHRFNQFLRILPFLKRNPSCRLSESEGAVAGADCTGCTVDVAWAEGDSIRSHVEVHRLTRWQSEETAFGHQPSHYMKAQIMHGSFLRRPTTTETMERKANLETNFTYDLRKRWLGSQAKRQAADRRLAMMTSFLRLRCLNSISVWLHAESSCYRAFASFILLVQSIFHQAKRKNFRRFTSLAARGHNLRSFTCFVN